VAETHVSTLFFLGDRAYKLLKPVDLGFLDHRRREARQAACRREVELNRRLAPDVYLGVLDVVDEAGRPLDHLVAMRRMPADRALAAILDAPEAPDRLREVAGAVAAFHARAGRGPAIDAAGRRDAVLANWADNLAQMRPFAGEVLPAAEVAAVERLARAYLEGRGRLFARRIADGRVCDGHGDLLAEDIFCLPDGPRILDCLAFDDRLRHGDVLADVAFLAMDLEARDHTELARGFLERYGELSSERHPASLADHYVAYRAHVRAKVACLRWREGDEPAADRARRLHRLAAERLERARVRLVLVGGTPGTGKSTLAAALSGRTGWAVLRSDEVRKDLAGLDRGAGAGAGFREGLYAPAATERVYSELARLARGLLELGESVVVDASWSSASHRDGARAVAAAARADVHELRCAAPGELARRRIDSRLRAGGDASDATPEIARRLAESFDPWPEARTLDTDRPLGETLDEALAAAGAG